MNFKWHKEQNKDKNKFRKHWFVLSSRTGRLSVNFPKDDDGDDHTVHHDHFSSCVCGWDSKGEFKLKFSENRILRKIWCDFERPSSLICGNKMPTASSIMQTGHITLSSTPDQQLENHSTKYHRQQPPYNTLELLMMGIVVPETCWAINKICNKNLCCI